MRKYLAVAMTAALVLPATGVAAAQDEKITIDGLVWIDRNGNKVRDAGEVVLPNEPGGSIVKVDTGETVAEFSTDAGGKYRVENLPAGKYRVELAAIAKNEFHILVPAKHRVTEGGTVDLRFLGGNVQGASFLDANQDNVRQADEELLNPGTLNGKPVPMPGEDGKFIVDDLRFGDFTFVAADHSAKKYQLVDGTNVDKATRTLNFKLESLENSHKLVDVRNVRIKGDLAIETPVVLPAKDAYLVGDEVDVQLKITNKGTAAEQPEFMLMLWGTSAKTLSFSGNVTSARDNGDTFKAKEPLAPGQTLDVKLRVKFLTTELESVHVIVVHSKWGNDPMANNNVKLPVRIVEKGAETTTPTTSPTTTTTTTPAVANVSKKDGLASTGASPLGFLSLGSLLLLAGAGAFLVARRRRS